MLNAIKKLKGFGVFDNFTATAETPVFKRYNLIFGENGSGKTTLSRLLSCLEEGGHRDHPDLEFTIESDSGQFTHGTKYPRKIRVFNSDYIEANIGKFEGPLRHILILGEENKELADELKREITILETRIKRIDSNIFSVSKLDSDKGKLFSQIAKTIGEATSGSTLRSYRKPDAEKAFATLKANKALSSEELETHRATVRQEQMDLVIVPCFSDLSFGDTKENVVNLAQAAVDRLVELTRRTTQSATIERLITNPEIGRWVETGVQLHKLHFSKHCEFCEQALPIERVEALANHFSIEDQLLKEVIEAELRLTKEITQELVKFELTDKMNLYSEIREEYDELRSLFFAELKSLILQIEYINRLLQEKLSLRTTAYVPEIKVDAKQIVILLGKIGLLIERHNQKTRDFDEEKRMAHEAIEAHYLLTISDQVEDISDNIKQLEDENRLLKDGGQGLEDIRGIQELTVSIDEKQARVSDAHAGGADLTEHLKQFLGRTDLRFESGQDGYTVLRRGKAAKRLSEGEKTAIAFLYFLVQLKDQEFNLSESIIVIDDPISSLDSSAIYQAFSFLKNSTSGASQLFILTHNFEFLKLIINWFKNLPGQLKKQCSYSMVICTENQQSRSSQIKPLDKLLIEHATEYHYLFKVLYTFRSDGTLSGSYHIPNIARKVLETFLDFHVPSEKSLYQKLDDTQFDPHKKTAIYKFANDLSHFTGKGFDPALVSEAQKNSEYLLDMIREVAPLHYRGLKEMCDS